MGEGYEGHVTGWRGGRGGTWREEEGEWRGGPTSFFFFLAGEARASFGPRSPRTERCGALHSAVHTVNALLRFLFFPFYFLFSFYFLGVCLAWWHQQAAAAAAAATTTIGGTGSSVTMGA